jgi:hypothetical protein
MKVRVSPPSLYWREFIVDAALAPDHPAAARAPDDAHAAQRPRRLPGRSRSMRG